MTLHLIVTEAAATIYQPRIHCDRCGDIDYPARFDTPEAADRYAVVSADAHAAAHRLADRVAADPFHGLTREDQP